MPKKILLADDSITIQKVVELTFSEGDYQVFSVGNGALALNKIQEVRPDIALLDVIMPEANGYEVCEKVKRNPETSWIPVLLLTGTFEPFDRKRAEAAGANGHLTKPFESQMLISKVEELIASSHHPVVEPGRAGRMEIVAGGALRVDGQEVPQPVAAEDLAGYQEEEQELNRSTIVPDRFDDFEPAPPVQAEGVHTVRIPSEEVFSSPDFRAAEEGIDRRPGPGLPAETWDELASGLAAAPLPARAEETREIPPRNVAPEPRHGGITPPVPEMPASSPRPAPQWEPEGIPPTPAASGAEGPAPELSNADVERIASKVVEQLSEKVVREIAWEVIPELAENLIKQRIRELEEKIAREG